MTLGHQRGRFPFQIFEILQLLSDRGGQSTISNTHVFHLNRSNAVPAFLCRATGHNCAHSELVSDEFPKYWIRTEFGC